jgi:hypothetical protein
MEARPMSISKYAYQFMLVLVVSIGLAHAESPYPAISLHEIPEPLQEQFMKLKPEMTQYSHCATAFDSHSDGEKMAFRCSIYIKMSAEGERRAMRYCEERRSELKINAPCKLIVEP